MRYGEHAFVWEADEGRVEAYWRQNFDPEFGRYMAWVWFSVGAENLVKAALVCNGLLQGKPQNPDYPLYMRNTNNATWVDDVLKPQKGPGGGYGALGDIWGYGLDKLAGRRGMTEAEGKKLKAAYKYFTQAVRNRDAHSYFANQRRRGLPGC